MAPGLGFEPRLTASKAGVLPLDDPGMTVVFYLKTPSFSISIAGNALIYALGNWDLIRN